MPQTAIIPAGDRRPVVRNALYGGAAVANASLLAVNLLHWIYSPELVIVATLIVASVAAGVAALGAVLVTRRRPSLSAMEHHLERAIALLERGLIDEQDYQMLKQRILVDYGRGRPDMPTVARVAGWAALFGALVPLFLFAASPNSALAALALGVGAVVGSAVAGGTTYAVQQLGSGPRFRPLGLPDGKPALDAGQPWLDSPANRDVG